MSNKPKLFQSKNGKNNYKIVTFTIKKIKNYWKLLMNKFKNRIILFVKKKIIKFKMI